MVYDISNPQSFEHLANWKNHFMQRSQPDSPQTLPFLVLGNKLDLEEQGLRRVQTEDAEEFCQSNGNMIFYETSAKSSVNVEQAFNELAIKAVQRQQDLDMASGRSKSTASKGGKAGFGKKGL
mmetsp:Transcript_31794/g.48801  ORF Transcript_31794/g.48801 Transcript_31794/m.48801 type:complete len:123 (+) Transcript_31794:302-670(+)